jgi:hypothetical protein
MRHNQIYKESLEVLKKLSQLKNCFSITEYSDSLGTGIEVSSYEGDLILGGYDQRGIAHTKHIVSELQNNSLITRVTGSEYSLTNAGFKLLND